MLFLWLPHTFDLIGPVPALIGDVNWAEWVHARDQDCIF